MQVQINPSVTNPTIATIYQNIASGKLILKPDFQRKFVWTHNHQEEFIDTILKGYPFPEIYVCQGEIDTKKLLTTEYVIDGQQRLTTIKKYIDGEHEKPLKKVSNFADLSEEEKQEFLSYQMVVRDIGRVNDNDIREIFRRINLTKFQLEDVEIHNAVYNGKFIQTAKDILQNIDLSEFPVFSESEFTRMADLHFILLIISTLEEGGYFSQDKEIEKYIVQFNDEYPPKNHRKALLIKTFAIIKDLKLAADSIWYRKSNFFTMVTEIAKHKANIPENLAQKLTELEQNIMSNKHQDNEFGKYYDYMYAGTNNRSARILRAEILNKYIYE
ncbi:MAG: DUF262 domain-containing protein [Gomphosphaeria aponina SAG 52.96 = DSM 107014]|uniref:DUF262 domain-containing protein n=1 Tax=Gomphosphaeria aponina SAG 52.96 = DSM 107014 TaxID=1521640 RepID=A0A941GRP9_9CHRO|nr:DUF262 domain-containing protein [Gomphosphaeria aponina SAG 52.96 = DSM 107014]